MTDTDNSEYEGKDDKTWRAARKYVGILGPVSSLFSACIRAINKAESVLDPIDQDSLKDLSHSSADFLLQISPTLKSVFYFAGEELHAEDLKAARPLTTRKLLALFSSREVATVLGLTYLARRCRKRCDEKEWMIFQRKLQIQMAIGAVLGSKMRFIGRSNGMLIGAIRYLSMSLFAIADLERFRTLRRELGRSHLFNLTREEELFGCNHLQIGSLLVQSLGFCMPSHPASMSLGIDALQVQPENVPRELKSHLVSWKAAMLLIEAYHLKGGPSDDLGIDYALELTAEDAEDVRTRIWDILRDGEGYDWLLKTKTDLPADVAQELKISVEEIDDVEDFR